MSILSKSFVGLLVLFASLTIRAQDMKSVKGIVVSNQDVRLAACTISIKGTDKSVTANNCGEFEIQTDKNLFTLVFKSPNSESFETPFSEHDLKRNDSIVFRLVNLTDVRNEGCNRPVNLRLRQVRVR